MTPTYPTGICTQQLAALLQEADGPVHVRDIRGVLDIKPANVHNVVAAAVKAGLVRRVGSRTGLVGLEAASNGAVTATGKVEAPEGGEAPAEPERLEPAQLVGIQRRVFDALVELGEAATAKEVAGQLGCRPREAGNALALLVRGGLAAREVGDGSSASASQYRTTGS